jgi:hypothetical protein
LSSDVCIGVRRQPFSIAAFRLDKIYKLQGVVFTLRMVLTNLDVINYSGYMEGSLDLDEFSP